MTLLGCTVSLLGHIDPVEFSMYFVRWQLSSIVLTPVIYIGTKKKWPAWLCAVVANAIGAVIFYFPDKYIIF